MAILRRTERELCGAKLMEKKRTEDLMEMLGLKEILIQMAKVNGVSWDRHVLRKALEFEGQEEARMTEEDVEDASGEGEQECWFGEGGCLELSET